MATDSVVAGTAGRQRRPLPSATNADPRAARWRRRARAALLPLALAGLLNGCAALLLPFEENTVGPFPDGHREIIRGHLERSFNMRGFEPNTFGPPVQGVVIDAPAGSRGPPLYGWLVGAAGPARPSFWGFWGGRPHMERVFLLRNGRVIHSVLPGREDYMHEATTTTYYGSGKKRREVRETTRTPYQRCARPLPVDDFRCP